MTQSSSIDVRALALSAHGALQSGDARTALALFNEIVARGAADVLVWLGLAGAHRQIGDTEAFLAALDTALGVDPANLRALLLKGDYFLETGDDQAAVAFYRSALRAAPAPERLSAALRSDLQRAQQACEEHGRKYEAFLFDHLTKNGFDPKRSSRRFAQSVELMMGRREIFYQQPQHFYFPELPQIQFYEPSQFTWLDAVEAATGDIRAELQEILRGPQAFAPYVESYRNRPNNDATGTTDNPDWSAFFLWKGGELVAENAARCPKTLQALKDVPLCRITHRTPSVLFSLLRPGARIPPHTGMINARLICHLPLVVPEKCGFRVGNETRAWREGQALVFDDTIEHEAWNDSAELRVVLLFDVWRPELSAEERALVTATIEAVDAYGKRAHWQD